MGAALHFVAALAAGIALATEEPGPRHTPSYSAASIVNAASQTLEPLAAYTFATIYGTGLSYATRAIQPEDIRGGRLPTELAGVRVLVDGTFAVLYYVSPGQINLLLPSLVQPPEARLSVLVDGVAGPTVKLKLSEAAPALFQWEGKTAVATRPDWTPINAVAPARPGDYVILFAAGLGPTDPMPVWGQPPQAAPLARMSAFRVLLNNAALEAGQVLYAGAAPGWAGLYQVNIRLPERLGDNPEIRLAVGELISPPGIWLPVRAAPPAQREPAAAR